MQIKEIDFEESMANRFCFDVVELEDIFYKRKPIDHSQFNHHKLSFFAIIIITENSGQHSINYQDYSFEKGTVFTIRKNNIHKFYKSNAKGKLLVFTEDFIIKYSDKMGGFKLFQLFNEMLGSPKLQLDNDEFIEVKNLIGQIELEYSSSKDEYSIEIIRSLFQALVLKLFRVKSKRNNSLIFNRYHFQFIELQKLIEAKSFENRTVAYYANELGVSVRTIGNITQSIVDKSAKSFIDEIVILQIKKRLLTSSASYTEIAYQTGFTYPNNFFKYFKKMTGISPKQFKEDYN